MRSGPTGEEVAAVLEIVVLLAIVFAGLVAVGAVVGAISLVGFFLTLPFRILGWLFHALGGLIAFPILAGLGVVVTIALVSAALAMMIPLLPFALLAAGIVWLIHRERRWTRSA